ncbi:MAG TPA: hypothetical protein VMI94_16725 [Bryobacteraceae bacterium]|nr:hypothetical protein [Bryobacteraceae bacterium]
MDEFRIYLEILLGHACSSRADCQACRALGKIYQYMQTEIFSTVVYSETIFDAKKAAALVHKTANRAAAGPRRSSGA